MHMRPKEEPLLMRLPPATVVCGAAVRWRETIFPAPAPGSGGCRASTSLPSIYHRYVVSASYRLDARMPYIEAVWGESAG